MKKNMFLVASIVTASVCGMETDKSNSWTITFGGTKINVHQEKNMLGMYADGEKKVDLIVVGDRAQEMKFTLPGHDGSIGECQVSPVIYFETNNKSRRDFPLREDYNVCLSVLEPYVWQTVKECGYNAVRLDGNDRLVFEYYRGEQDHVIQEALKDLEFCYTSVLSQGLQELNTKEQRSIALPTLGVENYSLNAFPKDKAAPVAVKSIIEFIKKNSGAYDRIELFVEEDFEFDLYKELLMHWRGKENILLLYCAQKDPENICSLLPCDVIYYIVCLI